MKCLNLPNLGKNNTNLSQYLTKLMHKICFTISFITCLYMFRAPCAHHQVVKIALHSLWYHQTYRWSSRAHVVETCRGMK